MESSKTQGVLLGIIGFSVILLGASLWHTQNTIHQRLEGLEILISASREETGAQNPRVEPTSPLPIAQDPQPVAPAQIPPPQPTPPPSRVENPPTAPTRCTDDACAQRVFVSCQRGATIATGIDSASGSSSIDYRYEIVAPGQQPHECSIKSFFIKNPQPLYVGPTMTCSYDTRKPYLEAVTAPVGCQGELAALLGF